MNNLKQLAENLRVRYKTAAAAFKQEKEALASSRQKVKDSMAAQTVIQSVAQVVQQKAHDQIAAVVSRCLSAVFDDPYEFEIVFNKKRGRTEAQLVFKKGSLVLDDPADQTGGGVLDVAAFALRVASLMLQRPRPRRLLVLDEPFKHLSERNDYRQRVASLLETLSREMKIQIVMVTHDPILQVGKVVEIS
jgi:DNA repair exonuclease SbcCD ATPase subunit